MTLSPDGADRYARVRAWIEAQSGGADSAVSLAALCETASLRLGMGGAAVTVETSRGWAETRYSTGDMARRLVELQVTVGEGPCLDATRTGGPVLVSDLGSLSCQRRWPLFAPLATEAGVSALFALPLRVGSIRGGTLVLHRAVAGALSGGQLADALTFTELALRFLLDGHAGAVEDGADCLPLHDPQLHQATGMIAAQLDTGIDEALSRLRAHAFATRRPLADLAADVVARRVTFDPSEEAT
ncbi:ANTAR domain-containing protein [Allokutzneria sp. A3M-2-11 16]|uniref:ANTAR domain-containing protein n=1 Tax=Allokutzneria sp. A3M-2-11 16 TaxID=2962043 RepID=UPI0020B77621|nr:ANTAR domain-containing protein [Allokutzneria sp. A3M-2-11 16]MCP3805136.1 ANTAR domain-containing protein [Allokutzneria sp. A3M-2-11 16]